MALQLFVTEGAGLLYIKPLLETASVEEVAARGDDSRLHVLQEGTRHWLSTELEKPTTMPDSTWTLF